MPVVSENKGVWVVQGDCLTELRSLKDNSIDSIVTDPPYGLSNTDPEHVAETLTKWVTGDHEYTPPAKGGFMGKTWDSFVPPPAVWDECLRVLKPGGHMLVFAGSRTQDLMGLSIRLAGFEIRDSLAWIYGSGMPKSHDVSKAIDKQRDDRGDILRVTSWLAKQRDRAGKTNRDIDAAFGTAGMAGHWTSTKSQPAVPKWEQWQTLRELLDLPDDMDAEVWRLNGRKGTPGENWDKREVTQEGVGVHRPGDTIKFDQRSSTDRERRDNPATPEAERWAGWGTSLKPAIEPVIVARKPIKGTVAANVLEWGTGALNIDASRVPASDKAKFPAGAVSETEAVYGGGGGMYANRPRPADSNPSGRWPANVLLDPEAAEAMDQQSGPAGSNSTAPGSQGRGMFGNRAGGTTHDTRDAGGASRFFPVFKYQAKAPKKERPVIEREDGTKVQHPTVKPLALMEWLVTLITPPGGIVLDPFAGSGTTAEAAINEGFRCVAIEGSDEYIPLIQQRIERAERTEEET